MERNLHLNVVRSHTIHIVHGNPSESRIKLSSFDGKTEIFLHRMEIRNGAGRTDVSASGPVVKADGTPGQRMGRILMDWSGVPHEVVLELGFAALDSDEEA